MSVGVAVAAAAPVPARSFGALTVPGSTGQAIELAVSGSTAVVPTPQGAYVFIRPPGGWESETPAARLQASERMSIGRIAVSSGTVVAEGATGLPVFTEPADGWSGTVANRAVLTASARSHCSGFFGDVDVSAGTIVASCTLGRFGGGPVRVLLFTRPVAGWNGSRHEAAILLPSKGDTLFRGGDETIAVSGSIVVATGFDRHNRSHAYVFAKPRGGWHGFIRPVARLTASGGRSAVKDVAMSGSDVITDGWVFVKPRAGWKGEVHQRARLQLAPEGTNFTAVATSDRTVAISSDSLGSEHGCPCGGVVQTFTEPRGGWSGLVRPATTTARDSDTGTLPIGLDGSTLFIAGYGASDEVELLHPQ
jgi:hypothetical protein